MNINKILILGSSALKIGEAGEFDYSGSQAIKAIKEEKIGTILINPNIATIQTSDYLADKIYLLPINKIFVEKVIHKEKPDGILLSFGGQTALNCGIDLFNDGILKKYNVRILGTPIEAIISTEDRQLFYKRLKEINVKYPKSYTARTMEEATRYAKEIGYPVIIRIAYALGGLGSGVCKNEKELKSRVIKALSLSPQILIEEYLDGWKEIEYEVIRDKYDNCVVICNMENFDPMGIHTGESIVVAPSQTLTNNEYHTLREIAIKVIRYLGIIGESNIQFAINPKSGDYRVIEVNARLSRSSALASKATGYPIAFVAAKLALGYGLHEIPNSITKTTTAFFEPSLDYIVVKIPRWDLQKFRMVNKQINSSMKSVGEVMAIGKKFEEAIQKAIRMLGLGLDGLTANSQNIKISNITKELKNPTDKRLFAIISAIKAGLSVDYIHNLTKIDKWFLYKLQNIVKVEEKIKSSIKINKKILLQAKQYGFSDKQIANILNKKETDIYKIRKRHKIHPIIQHIDTLAGEYPAKTNYLYLTYNASYHDFDFTIKNSIIILGSGPYSIGNSVEFDWCCVNTAKILRDLGYKTVIINSNPETVSTDYDESDILFFEELTSETIREIYEYVRCKGLILSMGGQIPNNLALTLDNLGLNILGTPAKSIDIAEDRDKFSKLLDRLSINQPCWSKLTSVKDALKFAKKIGYPVLIRPSYVLSGASMAIATNHLELIKYLNRALDKNQENSIVISKFIENAKEIEFDGVARNGEVICYAISEHVENAGVHSGDATLVFPPQRIYIETIKKIKKYSHEIAKALYINGPFNIQFLAKENKVYVIECNLRASRSFPFISKILKTNFIEIATKVIVGKSVEQIPDRLFELDYVGVKAPEFSFTRLEGADPTTGVEMLSTGEVACIGKDFNEAFIKALMAVGFKFPIKSVLISSGNIESKAELLESTKKLANLGVKFYATPGTGKFMETNGLKVEILEWPLSGKKPNTLDFLKMKKVDLVVNIPKNNQEEELTNDYLIRRTAVDFKIPLITNRQLFMRLAETLESFSIENLEIKSWNEY